MNSPATNPRTMELLIDRATVGLTDEQHQELRLLLAEASIQDDFSFEEVVALVQQEGLETGQFDEPLPVALRDQLVGQGVQFVSGEESIQESAHDLGEAEVPLTRSQDREQHNLPFRRNRRELLAWLVTAASLLLAGFLWLQSDQPAKSRVNSLIAAASSKSLDQFVTAANPDQLFQVDMEQPGDEDGGTRATVYWDRVAKRGFLKVSGLSANDASKEQYQLWIIDRERGIEDRPNAGVFDIERSSTADDAAIFEFRSELAIGEAQGFAITIEKPGGVAKSDLSRIALANLGTP